MFGATVLAPLLMGFDPNVAILFSGIGTLIFFVAVGGRVPSYLARVLVHRGRHRRHGYAGSGPTRTCRSRSAASSPAGALVCGHRLVVMKVGLCVDRRLIAAAVTGAVVAVIGLNPRADRGQGHLRQQLRHVDRHRDDLRRRAASPCARRGSPAACRSCWVGSPATPSTQCSPTGSASARAIDFGGVLAAPWLGFPHLEYPVWNAQAIALVAPVAIVLVAENPRQRPRPVAAMTGQNLDPYLGRAFLGDGIATNGRCRGWRHGRDHLRRDIGVMGG
jgi:xanthine/uracil permease